MLFKNTAWRMWVVFCRSECGGLSLVFFTSLVYCMALLLLETSTFQDGALDSTNSRSVK